MIVKAEGNGRVIVWDNDTGEVLEIDGVRVQQKASGALLGFSIISGWFVFLLGISRRRKKTRSGRR